MKSSLTSPRGRKPINNTVLSKRWKALTMMKSCVQTTQRQLMTRSFCSIFSRIVKDIPLVMKKGVEGIHICCSSRSEGIKITRTECGKYGKTSRNVFNKKIDYASVKVSTHYEISGVKRWRGFNREGW